MSESLAWVGPRDDQYEQFAGVLLVLEVHDFRASAVMGIYANPVLRCAWQHFFPRLTPERVLQRLGLEGDLVENFKRALRVARDVQL